MKSLLAVLFWALIQNFVNADVVEYKLFQNQAIDLVQANLKILDFHLLPNWVDVTLEYSHNGSVQSSQWFAIGFGAQQMECTYAIVFEPQVDSTGTSITDVIISERQLGLHQAGRKLSRRLSFIETDISVGPTIIIRSRFIRPRVVVNNYLVTTNSSQSCPNNLFGYHQFPFNGSDINIIFAKGTDGSHNLTYHTQPNHGIGSIPLQAVNSISALNATGLANVTDFSTLMPVSCPPRYSLKNYTFAQRFDWPLTPRVCGMCQNNLTTFNVTLIPQSTLIQGGGINTNTFGNADLFNNTEHYQCMVMSNGSYPGTPVCGCTNVQWNDTSIVFLIDGAGYQNDSAWRQFTWKIMEGFLKDVMLFGNSAFANITDVLNVTNNFSLSMDVNVIIYGGINNPLQVQKLDFNFLQSMQTDPIPFNERYQSNLCNATSFAAKYLMMNSNATTKILVTIPWQSPSDELDCLVCGDNCTLAGIQSFTAKIYGEVDLSVVEMTFGAYDDCSYLYNDHNESKQHQLQEWPYVLSAISDFICFASENPVSQGGNFSLELLVVSILNAQGLYNSSNNITEIIEGAFEIFSNFSYHGDREFEVEVVSIIESNLIQPLPTTAGLPRFANLINTIVTCKDSEITNILKKIALTPAFSQFLNNSIHQYFVGAGASALVYSVGSQILFNETVFSTTGIQSTQIFTSGIFPTTFNMSTTYYMISPSHANNSVLERIRNFFRHLVAWKIVVIVFSSILVCLLLVCLCGLCSRLCRNDEYKYSAAAECEQENVPVVITNQSHYVDTQQTTQTQYLNQYNKARVAEDDQVYV